MTTALQRGGAGLGVACLMFVMLAAPASGAVYDVGPGKPYATIGAVPITSLNPGDVVNIHPKVGNTPYYEKVALSRSGTQANPITFQGVPDEQGNLPILDGTNAVQVGSATNLDRGLIQTGSGSSGTGNYIVIQNLELRNAYYTNQFIRNGSYYNYAQNAAGVFVQNGAGVVIRNCRIHGNGNGIQTGGKSQGVTNLLIEACHVEGNGVVGSTQHHNFYVGAEPVTVQYCYIGSLRSGANGQNYKDRSSGTVFRYNWMHGGPNGQLDLVDGGTQPADAYVYGNVFIKNNTSGNGRLVMFGGDSGGNRAGTLYFVNNTVVTTRSLTYVFQASSGNAVQMHNNIVYYPGGGNSPWIDGGSGGTVTGTYNWISPGYLANGAVLTNTIPASGNNPGFVNYAAQDYRLAAGSACINAGATTWPGQASSTATMQYLAECQGQPRPVDSRIDIGAYEYASPAPRVTAVIPSLGRVHYKDVPLTTIHVTFDSDVAINAAMVNVTGAATGPRNDFAFSYNSLARMATLQWPAGLANDTYRVTVTDTVTAGGVALDGEIDPLNPTLPSGDGAAGGDFECLVYRLLADVNEDLAVDVVDLLTMVYTFGLSSGDPGYDATCDLNDDFAVDVVDLLGLVYNFGQSIPADGTCQ